MGTPLPLVVLVGVIGLLVGSFLNVVIYRVPRGESVLYPGSHCPRCGLPIRPWQNVPVLSWILLRARCAVCHEHISGRYPLVELATGSLFAALTVSIGFTPALPAYLYMGAVAIVVVMTDLDGVAPPDAVVLPSYIIGILLLMPAGAADLDGRSAPRALIGMVALMTIYLGLHMVDRDRADTSSIKVAGLLGLYLGWVSWSSLLIGAAGALVLGGVLRSGMLLDLRARNEVTTSYVPALVAAWTVAVMAAPAVVDWYFQLFRHAG